MTFSSKFDTINLGDFMNNGLPSKMVFDRELDEEQLELIKRQYLKIAPLGKIKMDSSQYQLFLDKDNNIILPKGSLIHGTIYDLNKLKSIKKYGLLGGEFVGLNKDGTSYYCADFYHVPHDIRLTDFDNNFKYNDKLPFNGANDSLAFIIKPTSKIGTLTYYNLYDSKFDNNVMVNSIIEKESEDNLVSILSGIPSNVISGIIVGDKLLLDNNIINEIKRLFPNSYIVSRLGVIIRDRSNVIKIEDYEDITLKYTREVVNNKLLEEELQKVKEEKKKEQKEFSKFINSVMNSISAFDQAKILLNFGYKKIPKHLKDKLTDKELKKLSK